MNYALLSTNDYRLRRPAGGRPEVRQPLPGGRHDPGHMYIHLYIYLSLYMYIYIYIYV